MVVCKRINKWGDITMGEIHLDKLILHYENTNKAEAKSPRTIEWYTTNLGNFTGFLKSKGGTGNLADLDVQAVREYIVREQNRGLSPYSVAGKVRTLKAFSSWLFREGYSAQNILAGFKVPKVPQLMVEPLRNDEIAKLISSENQLTASGCRNVAMLLTFLDAGPRLEELCLLPLENAHIEEGYLKIMGKGKKERVVPFGSNTKKALWRYVIHFRPEVVSSSGDYLFLTLEGNPLSTNAVKLLFKRWGRRAGVPRVHAHLCRHTFATNFLLYNCGDVFRLQLILGHTTLNMVSHYVHLASAQAMINGKIISPIDQLGIKGIKKYNIDKSLRKTSFKH